MAVAVTRDVVIEKLIGYNALDLPDFGQRRAAVLVPLRQRSAEQFGSPIGELELILTRRTHSLTEHSGQVAFPGGRIDATDPTPESAALRETHEELGVEPRRVQLCGRLDDMLTVTGYHVRPVVGFVDPEATLAPNPMEVARVFAVPMTQILDPSAWEQRQHYYQGTGYALWHLMYDGEDVWGATAHMLRGFVELLWKT